MKIYLGSDHAGFNLKQDLIKYLKAKNHEVIDYGTDSLASVDYPDFAKKVCQKVQKEEAFGILICYTGIGMSIAANKYQGIRAALVNFVEDAKLTREHNNANVLCLSAKNTSLEDAFKIVDAFLSATFLGERHLRRVNKIKEIEDEERKTC